MRNKKLKYPNKKISETFLDFSSPLLDDLGKGATKHQVEKVLQITYTVWNAIVLDTVKDSSEHISMLRQTIEGDPIKRDALKILSIQTDKKEINANACQYLHDLTHPVFDISL